MLQIKDFLASYKLTFTLAWNDFKRRFVGSYLGIIWMIIQPCVTIAIYYLIWGIINNDSGQVAALVSKLAPWFFFSEALQLATNSLYDYSYLVKKVVFKVSILPQVKIFSAALAHLIFLAIVIVLCISLDCNPSIAWIQLFYYAFCIYALVSGLSYMTAAVSVFFKDMIQIVGIVVQIGMWLAPIMLPLSGPNFLAADGTFNMYGKLIKLNPITYIVEGYRTTLTKNLWFWELDGFLQDTIYFWLVTVVIFIIGYIVFKKLKPHFADVL